MRSANGKFQRRFEAMEDLAAEDNCPPLSEMSVDEMELLWSRVKSAE